jgi:hypothetical protein
VAGSGSDAVPVSVKSLPAVTFMLFKPSTSTTPAILRSAIAIPAQGPAISVPAKQEHQEFNYSHEQELNFKYLKADV